jgi:hypothetical protein
VTRLKIQRTLKSFLVLFLVLAGTMVSAGAQEIGDPWLESLRGATGTVIGDLTPRFGDSPDADTASGTGAPSGAEEIATTVDPADPKTAGYIREWIEIAEPPQNVTEGARFHYTYRGNMVGTTADGGIITSAHETGAFDSVFLWQNRRSLDSVNHCTMEDYVVARLADQPVDHCRGRYKAKPTFDGDRINQAIAACRFKDANALIEKIDTDKARQSFRKHYDKAFAHEEQTRALFARADTAFRNCDFDDAKSDLDKAARHTACDRYAKQIDAAMAKITTAAAREQKTKRLFSEADRSFKQGEFATALTRLNDARTNSQCKRYISRIEEAIEKVEGEIAEAGAVAPPPVNPPVSPPREPPVASGSSTTGGADYFVGVWALSPAACKGSGAVPRRSDRQPPGSIAGAIEQGIEEAMDIATKTLAFNFAADGTLHVIKSGGPPIRYGTWSVKGNVLTTFTETDGDTDTQTILDRKPDRFTIGSPGGSQKMTMYRCSTAAPAAETAAGPSARSGPDGIIGRWSIAHVRGRRIVGMRGDGVETVIDIERIPGSNPAAFIGTLVRAGSRFETARPGEQIMRFEILPDLTASHKKPFYEVKGRILYTRKIGDWQKLGRAWLDFDKDLNKEVITGSIVPWIRGEPDR